MRVVYEQALSMPIAGRLTSLLLEAAHNSAAGHRGGDLSVPFRSNTVRTHRRTAVSVARLHLACAAIMLAALATASTTNAQRGAKPKPASAVAMTATVPDTAPSGGTFDRLHFRSIGPATMSGRIDDLAVLERDPRIFYIAAATGGLWKTTNAGISLTPVFDSTNGLVSIGAVTIPAEDPNLVWVGTGENNNRQSSSWGDGVYKSTDGGASWKNMGLRDSKQVARIVIDPLDHDVVYVAALGDLWKSGGERGIYKSTDGGVTWTKVLDAGPDAGGTAIVRKQGGLPPGRGAAAACGRRDRRARVGNAAHPVRAADDLPLDRGTAWKRADHAEFEGHHFGVRESFVR